MGSSQSTPSAAPAPAAAPTPVPEPAPTTALRRRTFEQLVEEEIPIQRASVAMEGGAPSCMTLFDDFFSCFCTSFVSSTLELGARADRPPPLLFLSRCSSSRPAVPTPRAHSVRQQPSAPKPAPSTGTATRGTVLPSSPRSSSACRSNPSPPNDVKKCGSSDVRSGGRGDGWRRVVRMCGRRGGGFMRGRSGGRRRGRRGRSRNRGSRLRALGREQEARGERRRMGESCAERGWARRLRDAVKTCCTR